MNGFNVYIQEDDDTDEDYEEMNFAEEDEDIYENMDKE